MALTYKDDTYNPTLPPVAAKIQKELDDLKIAGELQAVQIKELDKSIENEKLTIKKSTSNNKRKDRNN